MNPQIEHQSAVQANAEANDIGGNRWKWPGIIAVIVAAILLGIILIGAWKFMQAVREERRAAKEERQMAQAAPATHRPAAGVQPKPEKGLVQQTRDALLGERQTGTPLPRPRSGVVYTGRQQRSDAPPKPDNGARERTAAASAGSEKGDEPTFVGMKVAKADVWQGNPDYFIAPGRKLACETVETLRGIEGHHFTARITDDVRGATGTQIAIPRDSIAYGKITMGPDDETGEMRVAATLEHIQWPVPQGVQPIGIVINSDLAEPLGDMGAKGNVRTHFLRRLGAAGAFAVIDMMTGLGASLLDDAISGGGSDVNVNIGPMRRGFSSLSREEYQRQARRKPTFDRPSYPCSIFVRQPLDTASAAAAWKRIARR